MLNLAANHTQYPIEVGSDGIHLPAADYYYFNSVEFSNLDTLYALTTFSIPRFGIVTSCVIRLNFNLAFTNLKMTLIRTSSAQGNEQVNADTPLDDRVCFLSR